jgi:outer membrane receptor protein involved in Fe transport
VKWLVALLVVVSRAALAQNVEPTPPAGLSDADLLKLSQGEAIEIYDQRPDKPFDRDTEVRLTGEQLAARGAVDLATALALLPDVIVRDAGRGGFNVDIRGARKGAVSVLVDGVLVTDPYYGTFDVSTIPITDIVQIRLATTPQSPIDGPGGPGGVIEVVTRDAVGPQLVIARMAGDTLPSLGISGTARVPVAKHVALRVAASGVGGARDFPLPATAAVPSLSESRHAATGSARLEYRTDKQRVAVDGFVDDRHYISPPSDVMPSGILMVDREATQRVQAKADEQTGSLQLQQEAFYHHLFRRSRTFMDPLLQKQFILEELSAERYGASALATQPIGKEARWAASVSVDHDSAHDTTQNMVGKGDVTVMELAGDTQYEHKTVRLDAAVGAAIPFGVGANPWPEAKLVAKWRPGYGHLELTATGARKGRVPSLRERFDPANGNPALGPEMATHAELRAVESIADRFRLEAAPFYKQTTGTVRASANPMDMGKLINLGTLDFWGADLIARVRVQAMVEVGGAFDYVKVRQEASGAVKAVDDPLDRLPHSRGEAWVQVTPEPRFSLLARVLAFGSSIDQTKTVPGYTIVQATATAQLSREYLAVLRCDDLLDARPETRSGYHSAGRVISVVLQGQWQ